MINSLKIGNLTWRHLNNPNEEDFEFLKDRFHFHPLDIEDCKSVILVQQAVWRLW